MDKTDRSSELRALIGLLYYCGLYGMNHHSLYILFTNKAGPPIFSAAMSCDYEILVINIVI